MNTGGRTNGTDGTVLRLPSHIVDAVAVLEAAARTALPEEAAELAGTFERLRALAWVRAVPPTLTNGRGEDRLLDVDETAERLGVTRNWLRRRPDLPFVVKLSEGVVRYSSRGIDAYIAVRARRLA